MCTNNGYIYKKSSSNSMNFFSHSLFLCISSLFLLFCLIRCADNKIDSSQIFNYIGKYSNIIEKTRAAEIASCIQQQKDLGCQATQVITINEDKPICTRSQVQKFWSYLGVLDIDSLNGTFIILSLLY